MTDLLRINGITAPVLVGSAGSAPKQFGESERAEDGTMLVHRRSIKETWKATIAHSSPTEARAWRDLVLGKGHAWPFDSSLGFYSSKGLAPSVLTNTTLPGSAGKYGDGFARVGATTGVLTYANATADAQGAVSKWTVLVWRFESGAWHHYIVRSDGAKWLDGATTATSTSWLAVSSGNVSISNTSGSAVDYDDLVVLPYEIPDSWAADIYGFGSAFSLLGKLTIDGLLVEAGTHSATVKGEVKNMGVTPATIGGTFYAAVRTVECDFEEI